LNRPVTEISIGSKGAVSADYGSWDQNISEDGRKKYVNAINDELKIGGIVNSVVGSYSPLGKAKQQIKKTYTANTGSNKQANKIMNKTESLDESNYQTLNKLLDERDTLLEDKVDGLKTKLGAEINNLDIDTLTDAKQKYKTDLFKNLPDDFDEIQTKYDIKEKQLLNDETQKPIDSEKLTDKEYKDHLSAVYELVSDNTVFKKHLNKNLTDALTEKILQKDKVGYIISDAKSKGQNITKEFKSFQIKNKEDYDKIIDDITYKLNSDLTDLDNNIVEDFKETLRVADTYNIDIKFILERLEKEAKKADIFSRDRIFSVYNTLKDTSEVTNRHNIPAMFGTILKTIEDTDQKYIENKINDIFKVLGNNLNTLSYKEDYEISITEAFLSPLTLEVTADLMGHVVNKSLLGTLCSDIHNTNTEFDGKLKVGVLKEWLNQSNNKDQVVDAVRSYVLKIVDKSEAEHKAHEEQNTTDLFVSDEHKNLIKNSLNNFFVETPKSALAGLDEELKESNKSKNKK